MGNVFARRSLGVEKISLEDQIQERQDYYDNLQAQLSIKCTTEEKEEACHYLGEFYIAAGKNAALAREVLEKNCSKRKYSDSCFLLGHCYLSSEGESDRDVEKAIKGFYQACELNNGSGCTMAGIMHGMGLDGVVPVDLKKAAPLYEKGCELGDKAGCYQAGMVARYAPVPGLSAEYQKALRFFHAGCVQGSLTSCQEAAIMYERGLGVEVNGEKANQYHQMALPRLRPDSNEV